MLEAVETLLGPLWSARGRVHVWLADRAKLLPHLNLTEYIEVGAQTFRAPVRQGIRMHASDVEPWIDQLIHRVIQARPGSFIDVGANLGQTLLKLKAGAPHASYFGFEPSPRCYCYLADLIAINKLSDCKIYPFALGAAPAVVELFQNGEADQAASVVEGFRPETHYSSRQFATVFPGDDVLGAAGPADISIVKIDVEGAERDVLVGLTRTLDRHRPSIICEVLPVYDETTDNGRFRLARQREIEAFLRERRYSIHRVGPDGALTQLEEFGVHSDLSTCNYLFSPAERGV